MSPAKPLSKNAKSVQDALANKGIACKVVEFSCSTKTAKDAALTIGCEVAQIVKSLIFQTKLTHKPILILVSGSNHVNEKLIEFEVGEKIIKADADFTREITGFAIGGVPPIGHKQKIDLVFIDKDLLKFDSIWAAAGTPNASFNLRPQDLLAITNGKVIAVS